MVLKREVIVVAREEKTARAIVAQLNAILGQFIDFLPYSLPQWLQAEKRASTVIVSTHILAHHAAQKARKETEISILRRSLLKDRWQKILAIPQGKKIMLVNDERDSAVETIALLYELGARHIELIPMYPGLEEIPPLKTAITPGEAHLIPPSVEEIIDIGDRVVDLSTLVDLLTRFDLLNNETMNIMARYAATIIPRSQGLQAAMRGLMDLKNLFQESLNTVGDGVITYDENGQITVFNQAAQDIFAARAREIIGQSIEDFLHEKGVSLPLQGDIQGHLLQIGNQDIIANMRSMESHGQKAGGVLTLQIATRVREMERKLRLKLKAKGHEAQYSFDHLIYKSTAMERAVAMAKKIAVNDLNVLIHGETGTGKELFAHAIHNESPRKNYPFVAINCSALPDSLLESELFGYEEGAFTGARKGGKPGLFEQAHGGTIFLDEIGDISPNLQARLLRVVQQKEILKIGATSVLPIDVRILAATNSDLESKAREGRFRADLYHRLNVLHIRIPSLRERQEDIPFLMDYFLHRHQYQGEVSPQVLKAFQDYHWPGNVRELENSIDYLMVMGQDTINIKDIPFYSALQGPKPPPAPMRSSPLLPHECFQGDVHLLLLRLLYRARSQGRSTGRRSLVVLCREEGLAISERVVQIKMKELEQRGLLEIRRGRGGCHLTEQGYAFLQEQGALK